MAYKRKAKLNSKLVRQLEVESKTSRLLRLADARVPRAANAIRLVGNLASYSPTPDQAEVLIKTLEDAIQIVAVRLRGQNSKTVLDFHLPAPVELRPAIVRREAA